MNKNKKFKNLLVNKGFWKSVWVVPSILFALISTLLNFIELTSNYKLYILCGLSFFTIIHYLFCFIRTLTLRKVVLNIGGSKVEITTGDIFEEHTDTYKVIAFNEFFDSKVDDSIISKRSLNGQYLLKFYPERKDILTFDRKVKSDPRLKLRVEEEDVHRPLGGRNIRYKLGSVFKDNDYFLVAFSKFDENNQANLRFSEYATCLLNFWDEVNTLYSQQTVVLPLLGSGITRHKDFHATNQELLELIIWTFNISKVKFKEPSKVRILIHENQVDSIDFYKLKELENNGI